MNINELKQRIEKISKELKVKASSEIAVLVDSQELLIRVMLEMSEKLLKQNEKLTNTIVELQETIKELRRQLGQNSKNSSKPPSTDGFKKSRSLRQKSGLKAGGQKGHSGAHME